MIVIVFCCKIEEKKLLASLSWKITAKYEKNVIIF